MINTHRSYRWALTLIVGGLLATLSGARAFAQTAWPTPSPVVSVEWLKDRLGNDDLVLLHVGREETYRDGHIEGARFVPPGGISKRDPSADALALEMPDVEELRKQLEDLGISDRSKVVVYFENLMIPPATRVVFTLEAAGLGDRVRLLDGGYPAWQSASYPTTSRAPEVKRGSLSPLKMQSRIVDAKFVQERLNTPGYKVVDARATVFYDGTRAGGSAEKPDLKGHIPGAASIPFTDITGTDHKLKSAAELAAAFKAAGLKSGDRAIVYCHIGQQATAVAFAAKTVGIDVLLYDGSFQDWSRRGLPVEAAPVTGAK